MSNKNYDGKVCEEQTARENRRCTVCVFNMEKFLLTLSFEGILTVARNRDCS
jgi:hypothetical protein